MDEEISTCTDTDEGVSASAGNIHICWNDGCVTSVDAARTSPLRVGLDLSSGRDVGSTRPRRVYSEGTFCSDSCALSYLLRVRDNPYYYTQLQADHITPTRPVVRLGSPFLQTQYNMCAVHAISTESYRDGVGANISCIYADLLPHTNQPEWNVCYTSALPWETWCCWNQGCARFVSMDAAFHIPTKAKAHTAQITTGSEDQGKSVQTTTTIFYGRGIFCSQSCTHQFLGSSSTTIVDPASRELTRSMMSIPSARCNLQTGQTGYVTQDI